MTRFDWPGGRKKPPSPITGWPELGAAAGHTGKGHLLFTWNVTPTTDPAIPYYDDV
jgi:hypothetical protein